MVLTLTNLPQDVLILVCVHMLVEDVLALMQTCRVMYALGSLDYLWHRLLSDWDIPLDIPLNTSFSFLCSNFLREVAVKSLKLDNRWRNPHLHIRRAQRIITQNFSFIDGIRLLSGGRWLVTVQYEQTARTHVTLWSTEDLNDCHSIFKVTLVSRMRFLHAHHHHALEQITIGIAFARGTVESIRVYNVFLQGDSSIRHSLVFEATSNELHSIGRVAGMEINGEIMIAMFASPSLDHEGRIICINLVSRVAAVLECPDWSFAWGRLKNFRRYFAFTTSRYAGSSEHTTAYIYFYELPSVLLDRAPSSAPCWPERLTIRCSLIASTRWCLAHPLVFELSDDVPTNDTRVYSFTLFGHPFRAYHMDVKAMGISLLRVSFDGSNIECTPTVVPCRSVPPAGEVRVSLSGKRAVWLNPDPDTHECTLMKFALERQIGNGSGSCISTLMPSFSGLPFNPRDFHCFVFDELSCKLAVGLPSGELYILHY